MYLLQKQLSLLPIVFFLGNHLTYYFPQFITPSVCGEAWVICPAHGTVSAAYGGEGQGSPDWKATGCQIVLDGVIKHDL